MTEGGAVDNKKGQKAAKRPNLGMSDKWRAKHLASGMHKTNCTWKHNGWSERKDCRGRLDRPTNYIMGSSLCECTWCDEQEESLNEVDMWTREEHGAYLRLAERMIEDNDINQYHIESLIRLMWTANKVIGTIGDSVDKLTRQIGVYLELH